MESENYLKEECGVFGIYDLEGNDVIPYVYYGLLALQHRGQESAGIAVTDTFGPKNKVVVYKDLGLVNEVFTNEALSRLKGNMAVGHVRYSTAGESTRENAQPLVINYIKGTLMLAHNGNLINTPELKRELSIDGAIFHTTIDTETIAYHIAKARAKTKSVEEAVVTAMKKIKGAYALVISSPRKLIGARDPFGFKPLVLGKINNAYVMTSESCAIETLGGTVIRDIEPGEIVTINQYGEITSNKEMCIPKEKTARCIFEYIYFSRPDTVFDGIDVATSRIIAGRCLAKDYPVEADLVVGVPESGNMAAQGFALESGIPYGIAFTKNSYIGRTFITPSQHTRELKVRAKLSVLKEVVEGKRIVMIDDSIVRGTTCAQIVSLLKAAGAKEVHMMVSAPPFKYPCYFGIDIPSSNQLIANKYSIEEIRKQIGCDSLGYLKVERLSEMVKGLPICTACFTGDYPLDPPVEDIRGEFVE